MKGFWWRLPGLRRLKRIGRGLVESLALMFALSLIATIWLVVSDIGPPNAQLLETWAQIGATLLVAYVLAVTWLVRVSQRRPRRERETRLGRLLGVGTAVLLAIGMSMRLATLPETHDWDWLNELQLGFAVGPLLMAGGMVVMQPLMTHEWTPEEQETRKTDSAPRPLPRPPIRSRRR